MLLYLLLLCVLKLCHQVLRSSYFVVVVARPPGLIQLPGKYCPPQILNVPRV